MRTSHGIASLLVLGMLGLSSVASAAPDSRGTDFWLMFDQNYVTTPTLSLFIAGETATSGIVAIPGLGFSVPFTVTPGAVTTVAIPSSDEALSQDGIEAKGIHVTANDEVTVYGLNRIQASTDAYLGLPTDILGTEYITLGFANTNIVNGTEFGVAATQNGTTVTITPSVTTGAHAVGVPYNVTLNAGQTYQLLNSNVAPADLSGTIITSTAPIAVFGGHECANIPNGSTFACDHIIEEMPPTSTWGRNFVTMPLATRTGGDTFRILAQTNGTQVSINGAVVATLNRGQFYQPLINGPSQITSSNPVLVAQYSNGTTFDGVTSDPFEMLIPPYEQFLPAYTVTTPASGFSINYINVVVPTPGVGSVTLDGTAVPTASFTAIGSSGFSGAQLHVGLGSHRLQGSLPFGTFVYGFDQADSYGYPGGMSLSPIAVVTTVTLAPKTATHPTGTTDCVTATVHDQNSAAVGGVRVDFGVTGPNAQLGFATTASDGTAQFCYAGASAGTDTIVGSVGAISDNATKTWTTSAPVDTTAPACALTGVVNGPPKQLQITVQDTGTGIQSIEVTESNNATVDVPSFGSGSTTALMVIATKIDQGAGAQVALRVTDVNGNVTECDPVVPGDNTEAGAGADSGGGVSCSVGKPGRNTWFSGLLASAVFGAAMLRRRKKATKRA